MIVDRHGRRRLRARRCTAVLCLLFATYLPAPAEEYIREVLSREVSFLLTSDPDPNVRECFSREVSFFLSSDPTFVLQGAFSREVSVLVTTLAIPARVTGLVVDTTPTGDRASLDWSGYNELAQYDVTGYAIYVSAHAFTDVSAMTPYTTVPARTYSAVLDGLAPWQDRYFAVVPVDALGGFDPVVECVSAHVVAAEVFSREVSFLLTADPEPRFAEAVSRETSIVVATADHPAPVTGLTVDASPAGDRATLDWSGYNELAQHDVARYAIYWSAQAFSDVSSVVPQASVSAGTFSLTIEGLAPWRDRYFAVVPVDVLGGFDPGVNAAAAYIVAGEVFSREVSMLLVSDPAPRLAEAFSREVSILVPEPGVPALVCYVGSPFSAQTSAAGYRAIDLDWSHYNELAQHDVVRYRIYAAPAYFDDVSDMLPVAFAPAGACTHTLDGLQERGVYALAVVAEDALGQWNPSVHAVYAQSSAAQVFYADVRTRLQGPYDAERDEMGTDLHAALPLISPHAEDALQVSSIHTNVTDWVLGLLVETNGQRVAAQSAWLRSDGKVVSPGHTQMVWKVSQGDAVHLVLKHRNHLAATSADVIVFSNSTITVDLVMDPTRLAGGTNACVELAPGVWGMIAGDCDGDGRITPVDRAIVSNQVGKTGYLPGDVNLDGVVTEEDVP